jgi:hypothetical protein
VNIYLLPHHRLDPRFCFTLEREPVASDGDANQDDMTPCGFWGRLGRGLLRWVRKLRHEYDHIVHGHEQIRLSRLVLLMDRDPELTLVIPAGMSRVWALQAVRGVIRSGLMALRSHAFRNVITALVMIVVLFGATPTHVAAVIFYPLIGLYAWGRYREDRLIRRTMTHLLEVRLAGDPNERFREDEHLAWIEQEFARTARPDDAYHAAIHYFDGLKQPTDGCSIAEHSLLLRYYSDIGRLDPYERYQDRIRKKLIETAKLVAHHLWQFWKAIFLWTFRRTSIVGVRVPNWVFVVVALGVVNGVLWGAVRLWQKNHGATPAAETASEANAASAVAPNTMEYARSSGIKLWSRYPVYQR